MFVHTDVEDPSIKVTGDMTIISWTPLDQKCQPSYILQYKQVDQVIFQDIIMSLSVVTIGLSNLEKGKEYIFQIYCKLTANDMEYIGAMSSPVTVLIPRQVPLSSSEITQILSRPTSLVDEQDVCICSIVNISLLIVIIVILLVMLIMYTGLLMLLYHKNKRYEQRHEQYVTK